MLEVLRAVQVARLRGQPARRISFRDIDVEQIGYIYEGLLGYSCADVTEVTVGLIGKEGEEPEIPLATLEALRAGKSTDAAFADAILAWVEGGPARRHPADQGRARQGASETEQTRSRTPNGRCVPSPPTRVLRDRLRPFIGIIRRDLRNRPAGGRPRRRARGRDARPARPRARTTPRSRSPRRSSGTPWNPWSTTRARTSSADELGAGRLRPDPRPQGRRHRLRLGRVPRRRRPLPRRPARRGLAARSGPSPACRRTS